MIWEKLNDNSIFAFLPALEPLFGARNLVSGEPYHHLCRELYGTDQTAVWKRRYRFLFDTSEAMQKLPAFGLQDFLLDVIDPKLTADSLQKYLLSLPPEDRLFRQCDWEYIGVTKKELRQAISDEEAMTHLYEKAEDLCPNYLAFSAFIRQDERYLHEFFSLASEMDTPELKEALADKESSIQDLFQRVKENLKTMDPLACSEQLMGKSFHNRGPYERFYYLPSLLLPYASVRLFYPGGTPGNRQLLFLSIREPEKGQEHILSALKALSDPTRYQILLLLARQGPLRGQDVSFALQLAPSTVSHHMTELGVNGLVTEEPVKTSKYYGIAKEAVKELLESVKEDLKIE